MRAQLKAYIPLLGETAPVRRLGMVLAVRFRRTAAHDYSYTVDVALPTADARLVSDMLESRDSMASVRYDLVRVNLLLPGGIKAATRLDGAPMMFDLVDYSGRSLFGATPDNVASTLGTIDVVQTLSDTALLGTSPKVISALTSGVNRRRGVWVARPSNLFRTLEFPMAIMRALDSPDSPCEVVARYHRLRAFGPDRAEKLIDAASRFVLRVAGNEQVPKDDKATVTRSVVRMANYEPVHEAVQYPDGGRDASVTLRMVDPNGQLIMRIVADRANEPPYHPGIYDPVRDNGEVTSTVKYRMDELRVAGANWSPDMLISFDTKLTIDGQLFGYPLVIPPEFGKKQTTPSVMQAAATILRDLCAGYVPMGQTSEVNWSQLFVVRVWKFLVAQFPADALDELVTMLVGEWARFLFAEGFRDPEPDGFWQQFTFHLVTRIVATQVTMLASLQSTPVATPREGTGVSAQSTKKLDEYQHPDYAKLARGLAVHLVPYFGDFYTWTKPGAP